jgi:hypothetical protein
MDAVPTTKQKRFSISTPFLNFSSSSNRARTNFTKGNNGYFFSPHICRRSDTHHSPQ